MAAPLARASLGLAGATPATRRGRPGRDGARRAAGSGPRRAPCPRPRSRRWRPPWRPGCGSPRARGQELGLPYPPFIGRWAPAATPWALAAAALAAVAGRLGAAPAARSPPPRSPRPCSALTLAPAARARRRPATDPASGRACSIPTASRAPNEYLPALARAPRRRRLLPRPLRRARPRAAGARRRATRPGCCSSCTGSRSTRRGALAWLCILAGAAHRAARLRARPRACSTSRARASPGC